MKFVTASLLLGLLLVLPSMTQAQIPNAGFETWASGSPTGWTADNVAPYVVPITQSSSAHGGSSALQGTVVSYLSVNFWPWASSEFSVSQRSASLTGWYKFSPVGGDSIWVNSWMTKSGSVIGMANFWSGVAKSSYTQFTATYTYFDAGNPDSCAIQLWVVGPGSNAAGAHLGSTMYFDDLAFSGVNGVENQGNTPYTFALHQNYPNPFNPSTQIAYSVAKEVQVSISLYNILGQEVASLVNETKKPGTYSATVDASRLSSGTYLYRMRAGDFVETRKMVVVK